MAVSSDRNGSDTKPNIQCLNVIEKIIGVPTIGRRKLKRRGVSEQWKNGIHMM